MTVSRLRDVYRSRCYCAGFHDVVWLLSIVPAILLFLALGVVCLFSGPWIMAVILIPLALVVAAWRIIGWLKLQDRRSLIQGQLQSIEGVAETYYQFRDDPIKQRLYDEFRADTDDTSILHDLPGTKGWWHFTGALLNPQRKGTDELFLFFADGNKMFETYHGDSSGQLRPFARQFAKRKADGQNQRLYARVWYLPTMQERDQDGAGTVVRIEARELSEQEQQRYGGMGTWAGPPKSAAVAAFDNPEARRMMNNDLEEFQKDIDFLRQLKDDRKGDKKTAKEVAQTALDYLKNKIKDNK